jgi:hypothetical protein
MATDLTIEVEDRPGELAKLGEAMGQAGVNIEGISGDAQAAKRLHVLVEDEAAARRALEEAGISIVGGREVLVVEVEDRPGTMGEVARKLADAGVNVDLAYATFGRCALAVGVDDPEKAKAAL